MIKAILLVFRSAQDRAGKHSYAFRLTRCADAFQVELNTFATDASHIFTAAREAMGLSGCEFYVYDQELPIRLFKAKVKSWYCSGGDPKNIASYLRKLIEQNPGTPPVKAPRSALKTLAASMKKAAFDRQEVKIAAGIFNPSELSAAAKALECQDDLLAVLETVETRIDSNGVCVGFSPNEVKLIRETIAKAKGIA